MNGEFKRYIAVDWKLRLTDEKQRPDNPYRVPTADLSRQSGHWTEPEIELAKKYHRTMNFSYLTGLGIFVWVQVFLDFVVSAIDLEPRMASTTFVFFVLGLLGLVFVVPACNLHVNYQVGKTLKHEYVKKIRKSHHRIDNHPVVFAVLAMVLVSLPYVFPILGSWLLKGTLHGPLFEVHF